MNSPGRYEVLWSQEADADLIDLLRFIYERQSSDPTPFLQAIKKRASQLSIFPGRGRIVPELQSLGLEAYREIFYGSYRLIYDIRGKRVFVHALFDGRRNLGDILIERALNS